MIAWLDPAFIGAHGLLEPAATLGWDVFLARNLLPVTAGNLVGGVGLVGAVYWFVYLRSASGGAPR